MHRSIHPLALVLTVLTVLLPPAVGRSTEGIPPRVDLGRIDIDNDRVTAPIHGGGTARLTLDPDLQRATKRLLVRARPLDGAIVVIDARTGRLLAASEYRQHGRAHGEILTTPSAPAASVFKIVTTAALLRKYVSPGKMVCFEGGERDIEEEHLTAARGPDAFCSPFRNALGYSRNAVYAQLASRILDEQSLLGAAESFGFNNHIPFDLPGSVGNLEIPEGKLAFARAAAGFVGSKLSPMGAAHLANVVALRGRAAQLFVVESADGYEVPKRRRILGRVLNESIAVELRRMMEVTVHSGTSLDAFSAPTGQSYLGSIRVAGKTGTLQDGPGAPTTMWFTGFAPSRRPEIVVSVMLNNGRVWRRKANEVARDVFRLYFEKRGRRGVTDPFADE